MSEHTPIQDILNEQVDKISALTKEIAALRAQVEVLSKAMFDLLDGKDKGLFIVTVETTIERGRNVNAEHKWRTARVDAIWQAARAAIAATGKE